MNRALLFAGALLLLFAAVRLAPSNGPATPPAFADEAGTVAAKSAPAGPRAPSFFSPGYLLAIALLAGGAAWAIHLRKTRSANGTGQSLAAMGALPLGPGASARLVRCGDEVLLLGVGSGSVTLLKSYPADAFADAVEAPGAGAGTAFADLLQRYATPAHAQAPHAR